jgi:3',5'-cyclic-AMP phosphodiesterase
MSFQNGPPPDGIDRRGMLKCMAWVGTGLVWTVAGGLPSARLFGQGGRDTRKGTFSFVQISDSHIGFAKPPNTDVVDLVLHTGDLTHLAKSAEFDTVAQVLGTVKAGRVLYVPGEHDFDGDDNKLYVDRFGKGTRGTGWYSFDHRGVHFVGLVNVASSTTGGPASGMGRLGAEQLGWLTADLAGLSASTPVVVFAHVPLWTVFEKWGWGTQDAAQALALLKRFGSVTVLNGHIHQVMQKVEGQVAFHTARSTAFPQNEPGKGTPGPIRDLPAGRLRGLLGLTTVKYVERGGPLAIADPILG